MSSQVDLALECDIIEPFRLLRLELDESISGRTNARAEIATVAIIEPPRSNACVVRIASDSSERSFALVLGRASFVEEKDGRYRFLLELHDPLWPLEHTRDTRKFRNLSVPDIVGKLCDEHGIAHRFALTETYRTREYTTQYRESRLAFIERLLESEGIHYRFEDDGTVVFGDRTTSADAVEPEGPFELVEPGGALGRGELGLHELCKVARVRPGRVTLADYNWKTPSVLLRESGYGERDIAYEIYDYPAGFRDPAQGAALARKRAEAERVQARVFRGRGNVLAFAPAKRFAFGATAGDAFEGRYLIVRVSHRGSTGEGVGGDDDTVRYENHFEAIPLATPFRPQLRTPRPAVQGTHTAMVRGPAGVDIHTDANGRFKAQFHWDREATGSDDDSRWLRILQESQTAMALARTGWEMFVAYVDGDPDRPLGVARAINGEALPSYSLPISKKMMTTKTPSSPATGGYNEIKLDDSAEAQLFYVRAEKDYVALVKNDKLESIDHDETHTVGTEFDKQVTGNQTVTIGANATASYGDDHALLVEGSRVYQVGGSEKVAIGGGQATRVGKSDSERVGSMRISLVGSFAVPDFKARLKSAAETFARTASPGGAALFDQGTALLATGRSLGPQGAQTQVLGALDKALDAAGKSLVEGKGKDAAIDAAKGSASASLNAVLPDTGSLHDKLDALKQDLDAAAPTEQTLSTAFDGAANQVTGGIYGSLRAGDNALALQQLIDQFFVGSISRSAGSSLLKVVGGAYVTAAVGETSWKVGYGYLETTGGVKLTAALGNIEQTVGDKLLVTVGGAVLRSCAGDMTISSPLSRVTVGAIASIASDQKIVIRGKTITVKAGVSLALKGGTAEVSLRPGGIGVKGDLDLKADGDIKITGSLVDITS